ncbi:hypothetical protein C8R43DRAFT_1136167 [Mycena crocata]|nr:hypothetical protein C8R43DRAFT_1136167 [Mycena crocata]
MSPSLSSPPSRPAVISTPAKRQRIVRHDSPTKPSKECTGDVEASLNSVPSDVYGEIASHIVSPLDMIALARSTQALHSFFCNRHNAVHLWRKAALTIQGLPPCPPDLCGLAYLALVLLDECTAMLNKRGTVIRTFATSPSSFLPGLKVGDLIRVQVQNRRGAHLTADYLAMKVKIEGLTEDALTKFLKLRRDHARDCRGWEARAYPPLKAERKEQINKKLFSLGFANELQAIGDRLGAHPVVNVPRQSKRPFLNDFEDWAVLLPLLEEYMGTVRADEAARQAKRLEKEADIRLRKATEAANKGSRKGRNKGSQRLIRQPWEQFLR